MYLLSLSVLERAETITARSLTTYTKCSRNICWMNDSVSLYFHCYYLIILSILRNNFPTTAPCLPVFSSGLFTHTHLIIIPLLKTLRGVPWCPENKVQTPEARSVTWHHPPLILFVPALLVLVAHTHQAPITGLFHVQLPTPHLPDRYLLICQVAIEMRDSRVQRIKTLTPALCGFESQLCHLVALSPWAEYLILFISVSSSVK